MIDDDDAAWMALLMPGSFGILGIAIILCVWWAACNNKAECATYKCPTTSGSPMLLKGECVCVERARP